ncbi:lipid-A-disaccharide synthase [Lacihabitans sp. LS3-19]|uniref:lipid-A-disaccharide synthase n=1 Tax=Lacihabitans sp. LS3-19 TaxID=2487335 RepID=UPI0020CDE1AC|nr:lipid-A-disaccharide synthase [Lacihabitans sp. LS3-19]MCP9770021.1 lipid-A-disaccharide synthase [Lacihabitans sp. LS3-19]
MKYFIIAGEKSGDMHAANLCEEIFRNDDSAEIIGWGGESMEAQGVKVLKNYRELAFMGFLEVIKNLFTILGFLKLAKKQILDFQPDILILVDYAGFNLKIAKWAKKENFKIAYYIAPKAWAWQESRAKLLQKYVDLVLVIFPFEKPFFENYGIKTVFVGNPLFDQIRYFEKEQDFKERNGLNQKPIIALLPGSRKQEIEKMLSQMSELAKNMPEFQWLVAGVSDFDAEFYYSFGNEFKLIFNKTYDILSIATAAVVTSGTATLETALFKVPQVVVYRTSNFSYQIAKRLVKIKYISLVNLVGEKAVVKELIQDEYSIENTKAELEKLIFDNKYRENQLMEYDRIIKKLGTAGASKNAAIEILKIK